MLHNATLADVTATLNPRIESERFLRYTGLWHEENPQTPKSDDLTLQLHWANFELWHLEDSARDPLADDHRIADVKRSIDRVNQRRNDLVEQVDMALLHALATLSLPNPECPLHSETPGLILDRLSILALKIFHTHEETMRTDATAEHIERNRQRLQVLTEQHADLTDCLHDLWAAVCNGERRVKLYRQMKMYNDPALNPVLYRSL
jgi:hypothetical protein